MKWLLICLIISSVWIGITFLQQTSKTFNFSVFNAKIEELEQHVGMLSNAPNDELYPEPQITSNVGEHSKQEMDSIVEEQ